jgi:hypothetical protein
MLEKHWSERLKLWTCIMLDLGGDLSMKASNFSSLGTKEGPSWCCQQHGYATITNKKPASSETAASCLNCFWYEMVMPLLLKVCPLYYTFRNGDLDVTLYHSTCACHHVCSWSVSRGGFGDHDLLHGKKLLITCNTAVKSFWQMH